MRYLENSREPVLQPAAAPGLFGRCKQKGTAVILPKDRDPRFITIRRGGTLTDSDHQLLALWAATCAEHVLHLFESAQPSDPRPRQAIEQARHGYQARSRCLNRVRLQASPTGLLGC